MQTTSLMHFSLHNSIWNGKVNARFSRVMQSEMQGFLGFTAKQEM
jgi:hypothetical protein